MVENKNPADGVLYNFFEVEAKIVSFIEKLQPSKNSQEKFKEIDKFRDFNLRNKDTFKMNETQIVYVLSGDEEKNIIGLCQMCGKTKYIKYLKRSSISALSFIYMLMSESGQIDEVIDGFCTLDVSVYDSMRLDKHFLASYNQSKDTNMAFFIIKILKEKRKFLPLRKFLRKEKAIARIEQLLERSNAGDYLEDKNITLQKNIEVSEPRRWADVDIEEDRQMFADLVNEEFFDNTEAPFDFKSTFLDPLTQNPSERVEAGPSRKRSKKSLVPEQRKESENALLPFFSLENIDQIIKFIHIQSEEFDPNLFLANIHSNSDINIFKQGRTRILADYKNKQVNERMLVSENVDKFAFSKKILDQTYSELFISSSSDLYSKTQEIHSQISNILNKLNQFINPVKQKMEELEEVNKTNEIMEYLRTLFELNERIWENARQGDMQSFVGSYLEFMQIFINYREKPYLTAILEKMESGIGKIKNLMIKKVLCMEDIPSSEIDQHLAYFKNLDITPQSILPFIQQSKTRILAKIEDFCTKNHFIKKPTIDNQTYSTPTSKLRKTKRRKNEIDNIHFSKIHLKDMLKIKSPIESFIRSYHQKQLLNQATLNEDNMINAISKQKLDFQSILNSFKDSFSSQIKVLSKVMQSMDSTSHDLYYAPKILSEIFLFLSSNFDKIFFKQNLIEQKRNEKKVSSFMASVDLLKARKQLFEGKEVKKLLKEVSTITEINIFPKKILTNENNFKTMEMLTQMQEDLSLVLPLSVIDILQETRQRFLECFINSIFMDLYLDIEETDFGIVDVYSTLSNQEEPYILKQFRIFLFDGLDFIMNYCVIYFRTEDHDEEQNTPFIQLIKASIQNIIRFFVNKLKEEAESIAKDTKYIGDSPFNIAGKIILVYIMCLERMRTNGLRSICNKFIYNFKTVLYTQYPLFKGKDPSFLSVHIFNVIFEGVEGDIDDGIASLLNNYLETRSCSLEKYIENGFHYDEPKENMPLQNQFQVTESVDFLFGVSKKEVTPFQRDLAIHQTLNKLKSSALKAPLKIEREPPEENLNILYDQIKIQSNQPFSEIRLCIYDLLQLIDQIQNEIFEHVEEYYEELMIMISKFIMSGVKTNLGECLITTPNFYFQLMMDFEFVTDYLKEIIGDEEFGKMDNILKEIYFQYYKYCKRGKLYTSAESMKESDILTSEQIGAKNKTLRTAKFKMDSLLNFA